MVLFILISSILICYFINILYYSYSILILILLSHIIFLKKASVWPTTGFVLLLNLIPQKANTFMGKLRGKWWCPKHTLPHLVFFRVARYPEIVVLLLRHSVSHSAMSEKPWYSDYKNQNYLFIHTHTPSHIPTHPYTPTFCFYNGSVYSDLINNLLFHLLTFYL